MDSSEEALSEGYRSVLNWDIQFVILRADSENETADEKIIFSWFIQGIIPPTKY